MRKKGKDANNADGNDPKLGGDNRLAADAHAVAGGQNERMSADYNLELLRDMGEAPRASSRK